jgi:hypothetical protein
MGTGVGANKGRGRTWLFLVVGSVIGLGLGVGVSIITDLPLAAEAGLVIGLLVGWLASRQHLTFALDQRWPPRRHLRGLFRRSSGSAWIAGTEPQPSGPDAARSPA